MPNITIHEKIGYELSKELNTNSYDYYLGLLSPDTPNLNGFGPKEERWASHVRRKDLNEWRNSLKDFYHNNKDKYNKDFLLGYIIHILTDIIFDDYFYRDIRKEIIKDYGCDKDSAHKIMRKDMDKYYFKEFEDIKDILSSSNNSYDILNNTKENIIKWKNKNIEINILEDTSEYINEKILVELKSIILKELKQYQ